MSKLQEKLDGAINDFRESEAQLNQAREVVGNLEKRVEQLRGRVVTLKELNEEQSAEVVDAELVEDKK